MCAAAALFQNLGPLSLYFFCTKISKIFRLLFYLFLEQKVSISELLFIRMAILHYLH